MSAEIPRLLLAGTASGSGKTTLACALLATLVRRGLKTAPFKCGPDYIDPLYHSHAAGTPSHTLDCFLCDQQTTLALFARYSAGADLAVIEGVMGLYDGVGQGQEASTNDLSLLTRTPVVLLLTPRGQGFSLCAEIHGFVHFQPNMVRGIILNNTPPRMADYYRGMIEGTLKLPVFGAMPPVSARFDSRHLGLITPAEAANFSETLDELVQVFSQHIDVDGLLNLARGAGPLPLAETSPCTGQASGSCIEESRAGVQGTDMSAPPAQENAHRPIIGVARDRAFCFYYQDLFALFSDLGAEVRFFSPLHDAALPQGVNGLFLGGGYPEEHAEQLAQNTPMLTAVREATESGMPVIAECGGYLYLCREIENRQGVVFPMTGVLPVRAFMQKRLTRFGYITLTAERDTLLCPAGTEIRAHEFHYSDSTDNGDAFTARKQGKVWPCIHASGNVFAGFPHVHWRANLPLTQAFLTACTTWQEQGTP